MKTARYKVYVYFSGKAGEVIPTGSGESRLNGISYSLGNVVFQREEDGLMKYSLPCRMRGAREAMDDKGNVLKVMECIYEVVVGCFLGKTEGDVRREDFSFRHKRCLFNI